MKTDNTSKEGLLSAYQMLFDERQQLIDSLGQLAQSIKDNFPDLAEDEDSIQYEWLQTIKNLLP
jgi:hypothetical protein